MIRKNLPALFVAVIVSLVLLTACARQGWNYGWPANYDQWVGRWTGVEGTHMDINKNGASYKLVIADLDGPQTYYGTPTRNGIEFYRGTEKLLIHAGTGADTGMKWLAEKQKCLVVKTGEGYCRD